MFDYWEKCFDASVIVQCAYRQYVARNVLNRLKYERDELYFPFGHDFERSSERDNWRAFGMVLPDLIIPSIYGEGDGNAMKEFCAPSYFLQLARPVAGSKVERDILLDNVGMSTINNSANSSGGDSKGKPASSCDVNVTHPPVYSLVQKLAVPDAPPNCLFPSSWMDSFLCQHPEDIEESQKYSKRCGEETNFMPSSATMSTYESMLITHFLDGPASLKVVETAVDEDANTIVSPSSLSSTSRDNENPSLKVTSVQRHRLKLRKWQRACWGSPVNATANATADAKVMNGKDDSGIQASQAADSDVKVSGDAPSSKEEETKKEAVLLSEDDKLDQIEAMLRVSEVGDIDDHAEEEDLYVFSGWLDGSVIDEDGHEHSLLPSKQQRAASSSSIASSSSSLLSSIEANITPLFPSSFYSSGSAGAYPSRGDALGQDKDKSRTRPLTGKLRPEQRHQVAANTASSSLKQTQAHQSTNSSGGGRTVNMKRLRWMSLAPTHAPLPPQQQQPQQQQSRAKAAGATMTNNEEDKEEDEDLEEEELDIYGSAMQEGDGTGIDRAQQRDRRLRHRYVRHLQQAHLLTPVYTSLADHGW